MTLRPVEVDFNESWGRLRNTLESVILLNNVNKAEWSERFSDVYKMCVAKPTPYPDELYEETKKFIIEHVKKLHSQIHLRVQMGDNLLVNYYQEWLVYRDGVQYMDKLYMYLNNQHLKKLRLGDSELNYGYADSDEDQKLEIGELGLSYWRKFMVEPLADDLVYLLLRAFTNDRLGNPTNESVIAGVIDSFVVVEQYKKKEKDLNLYREIFETPFLEATRKYYSLEASKFLGQYDCSAYMENVLQRLDSEILRSRKYLHSSSHAKVSEVCEEEMVASHLDFLHAECQRMVISESRKDLHNMFKLLKPIGPGIQVLVSEVQKHFTKIGLDAIANLSGENIANSFVENLLEVYRKQRDLINDVFNSDQQFIGALDKACSYVINHRINSKVPCRSAELLARYCDSLLKKTSKSVNEFEIDEKLRRSITIFKYIDDKDVFQKFYAKMLAKRLIHSLSVSMDSEESMINKLKQACGHEFTSKLHRMFTDVKISNDLNDNFSDWLKTEKRDLGGISFNIFVLQAGAWPLNQNLSSPFSIPQILEKSCSNFELFYNKTYHGRKLTFLHHLSTCEVRICFSKKPYLASMSTYYMAILLLFENTKKLTFKEIQLSTNLTEDLLSKHLSMLIEMKLLNLDNATNSSYEASTSPTTTTTTTTIATTAPSKSLTNTGEEGASPTLIKYTFDPETQLTLNLAFVSKRTRFKINFVNQKEVTQQQVEQTHSSVDEDRKLFLQAAVVRIMKARKIMKHNQLIQEVIDQAKNRFAPSIPMVKKCIEALIEKQYLERTAAQDEYSYIA